MATPDRPAQIPPLGAIHAIDFEAPTFTPWRLDDDRTKRFANMVQNMERSDLVLSAAEFMVGDWAGEFTERPDFAVGREASRQGVYFGNLKLENAARSPFDTSVAVKPYRKGTGRGAVDFRMRTDQIVGHDWALNEYLDVLSTGSAYKPLGIWRTDEKQQVVPQLVTEFKKPSTSLDNLLKDDGKQGIDVARSRASHVLNVGNFGLGFAHGIHITHNDAAPQNFAQDGKRVIYNDTTSMMPFSRNASNTKSAIEDDVFTFGRVALDLDSTSEISRDAVRALLQNRGERVELYGHYIRGLALGANRAGLDKGGLHLPPDKYHQTLDRVLNHYTNALAQRDNPVIQQGLYRLR